jgi:hypothetical protein
MVKIIKKDKKPPHRPTKWKKEYNDEMLIFFGGEPYEIKEIITEGTGKNPWRKVEYKIFPNKLPTLVNFARSIDISYHTVLNWSLPENKKKYPGFFDTLRACKERQKDFLMQNGLNGAYNAVFAKFTAINVSDMRDVQVLEGNPDKPLAVKNSFVNPADAKKYLEDMILARKDKIKKRR